jgi:hypothetical protein
MRKASKLDSRAERHCAISILGNGLLEANYMYCGKHERLAVHTLAIIIIAPLWTSLISGLLTDSTVRLFSVMISVLFEMRWRLFAEWLSLSQRSPEALPGNCRGVTFS